MLPSSLQKSSKKSMWCLCLFKSYIQTRNVCAPTN